MKYPYLLFLLLLVVMNSPITFSQEEEERILYYQMEPLDDSLFIQIQQSLFIDPPDPKAEIVVDMRDNTNQTISIKGSLYPLLALNEEQRARISLYPFKLNLEETINYGSVFTKVINKLRLKKIINPPSVFQISPTLGYINPFLQFMGGERFGFAIKQDIGLSFGIGTPFSGALETNYYEVNFHILGLRAGLVSNDDTFIENKFENNHNNIYFGKSYQVNYVLPFGNFFEFGFFKTLTQFDSSRILKYRSEDNVVVLPDGEIMDPYLVQGEFYNWEFRYPLKVLESTRSKIYVSKFLNEIHVGFTGRELSLAGSVFDFRFDALVKSRERKPQYVCDILIQKIFDYWAFAAIAAGPSFIFGTLENGKPGFTSFFVNIRLKIGTSL